MTKLRVATIGAGYFSQFHHDAWTRIEGISLVAVCDSSREKAEAFAQRFDIPWVYTDAAAMLDAERPDLVDIISPPPSHLALIRLAAARGVNVVCQKPFCQSRTEAQTAVNEAEGAGIRLVVHDNFRFQPWYGEIKRRLDTRALGEVYQATFRLRPGDGQGARLSRPPALFSDYAALSHPRDGNPFHRHLPVSVRRCPQRVRRSAKAQSGDRGRGCRTGTFRPRKRRPLGIRRQPAGGSRRQKSPADHGGDAGGRVRRRHSARWRRPPVRARVRLECGDRGPLRLEPDRVRGRQRVAAAGARGRGAARGLRSGQYGRDYVANLAIEEAIYASAQARAVRPV